MNDFMRHKSIYEKKVRFIDDFVDKYIRIRHSKNFPHTAIGIVIKLLFPKSYKINKGWYKTAFYISSRKKDLVIKIGRTKNLKQDWKAYQKFPKGIRNKYFAKIYWHSKYCLLQKWGKAAKISNKDPRIIKLKEKASYYGLNDIKPANTAFFDGKLKIIDASIKK
ncbi:MAG: hypothetical protein Q7R70_01455 [Candidatus Diapherotrites archaeon]|nr:hypothetical protein [Candidatus Diapherotrites archaeon]